MKKTVALLAIAFACNFVQAEDVTTAFAKCAVTKDDRSRLVCYDKIRDDLVKANSPAAQATGNGYKQLNLVDLKVDLKELISKKVAVNSLIQIMGETAMLKSDELDMAPIFADFSKLSRDDRKKLASGCQVVLCKGLFYGVVRQLPLGTGVALDKVEWR